MLLRNAGSRLHASLAAGMMAAMIAAPLIYSASVFSSENTRAAAPTIKVTIVQPDIDPHEKWKTYDIAETMTLHYQLTARAVYENRPDLVLWPETAIPFYILDPRFDGYMNSLRQSLALWNVTLLTGFSDVVYAPEALASSDPGAMRYDRLTGRRYETFNSSMMLGPEEQNPQIYHKIRLVPFGERVPYMEYFPWLERFSFSLAGISSWSKGRDTTIMEFRTLRGKPVRTANIICYESIFPGLVAEFVSKGAQFLTLVTNDGWYGTSYGPYQHAAIGRFRCIENRRSMARCANTGITLFYDRYGRSYAEIPWWERKTLTADISLENDLTLYTRYPDLFPKASLGVAALFVAAALLLPRKKIGLP
jgi:apolipoprotein N-acyltransferase